MTEGLIQIRDIFGETRYASRYTLAGKKKSTERGDCLQELATLTGYTVGRIAHKVQHLTQNKDLYYLISAAKDLVATGRKKSFRHALNSLLFVPDITTQKALST